MLIERAEIAGRGPLDVRLADGVIAEVAPRLDRRPDEPRLDAAGGALLPGLHDHHVHILAWDAARRSVHCGPESVADGDALGRSLAGAATPPEWVRGVGYHESVAGPLDRRMLDRWVPGRPVRVQHRSGSLWMLNSVALERLGLAEAADVAPPGVERDASGRPTGRLFRLDDWLRERWPAPPPPDWEHLSAEWARLGVVGATDATPRNGAGEWALFAEALSSGALAQRIVLMGSGELPSRSRGDGTAAVEPERGALKIRLDESALVDFDALGAAIAAAHAEGRPVAIHCVTRAELVFATAAFGAVGGLPGDRIEHAGVAPPALVAAVRALPLTVVTQPNFVRERGDAYLRDVEPADRPWLYRCRAWLEAGVPLGGGTDAPFGEPDPWAAMRAAVDRRTREGRAVGAREALDPEAALALFTGPSHTPGGPPRPVEKGAAADLVLLARPWREARDRLDADDVAATFRAGRPIHLGDRTDLATSRRSGLALGSA